jgi:transcription termination factor Rho
MNEPTSSKPTSPKARARRPRARADAAPAAEDAAPAPAAVAAPAAPAAPTPTPAPVARVRSAPPAPAAPAAEADDDFTMPAPPIVPSPLPPGKTAVIGITGEPGSGKSALARQLGGLGAVVLNVDEIGHELIETTPVKRALVEEFGDDIISGEGTIDRRALAGKAFATPAATAKLNAIVHPRLSARVRAMVKRAGNFVIIDAALLHELGLAELCSTTVYVRATRDARLARVAERGWDEAELARREAALGSADARRKACQFAVDNSGDPVLLQAFAKNILTRLIGPVPKQLPPARIERPVEDTPVSDDGSGDASASDSENSGDSGDSQDEPRRDEQLDQSGFSPRGPVGRGANDRNPDRQERGQDRGQDRGQERGQRGNQAPPVPEKPPVKVDLDRYLERLLPDLQAEADKLEVRDVKWQKKHDLICEILRRVAAGRSNEILVEGYVELIKDQHGYIRSPLNQYLPVNTDAFITNQQLRRYGLKAGMHVTGTARAPRGNERCLQLLAIHNAMGEPVDKRTAVQDFEHLIPLHAHDRLFMELPNDPTDLSLRIIDLVAPIGKGQRGLIVAQPKCGKTVYMQKIAKAIATNNPEVVLMVLLVDERPEEVTDMQRSVRGEVVASTFDQHASRHVQCAEMVINKAKRLVERGKDVVILLDSITRLARAYNTEAPNSGRILSGGIDSNALIKPKQFFGAARKIENGGSLTILATAIVDTGSLMDTVIFEEFKGTGNMELVLDRKLANRRVFPAVDCAQSGTRKDDLLIKNPEELKRVWSLRKFLSDRNGQDAIEFLRGKLKNYRTNVEFLLSIDPDKLSGW